MKSESEKTSSWSWKKLVAFLALGVVVGLCLGLGSGTSASEPTLNSQPQIVPRATLPTPLPSKTPTKVCTAIIGDRVWLDLDWDGLQDPGEPGVPGVTVRLLDSNGNFTGKSIVTDGVGVYYFKDLITGYYYVEWVLPSHFVATLYHAKDDIVPDDFQIDSDADPVTLRSPRLRPNCDHNSTIDMGIVRPMGYKFKDANGNGARDAGEALMSGWHIIVRNAQGAIVYETDTLGESGNRYGAWIINKVLPPGAYTAEEVMKDATWQQTYPNTNGGIYRFQMLANGDFQLLSPAPQGYNASLDFGNNQPQGCRECPEWVVFQSNRENKNWDIYRVHLDGTQPERLTIDLNHDIQPIWDYTAERIAFASRRDGDWEIYRMNGDGTSQVNVTNKPLAVDGISPSTDLAPSWNCDEIVFQSDRDGNWEIYRTDPGGLVQTRLTFTEAQDIAPVWSPLADKIAFQSDRDGDWDIYIMDPDGTDVVQITDDPASDRNPSWSPDHEWLYFDSDRVDGQYDIFKINLDTKEIVRLTEAPSADTDPDADPYCEWVFFESDRLPNDPEGKPGPDPDIWRMRADGTDERNIIFNEPDPGFWLSYLDDVPVENNLYVPLILRQHQN